VNSQIHDEEPTPETAEQKSSSAEQGQGVSQATFDALQTQAQEYLEGWQRNRAEFANYKKRIEREMKDTHSNAAGSVLKDILPAIDDFDRAMNNIPDTLKDDKWVGGVGMVLRKFNKILEDYNVTVLDPVGEPFDPNLHEAIGMDDSDSVATGHVTATMQKGYVLGDRVLRPALVRVAK
jgi:molecular chaperone GrpE